MRTTPEQRAALRARATPEPAPICRTCGGPMQRWEWGGDAVRWQCPVDGRVQYTDAGDLDMLALLDDLEELLAERDV